MGGEKQKNLSGWNTISQNAIPEFIKEPLSLMSSGDACIQGRVLLRGHLS